MMMIQRHNKNNALKGMETESERNGKFFFGMI